MNCDSTCYALVNYFGRLVVGSLSQGQTNHQISSNTTTTIDSLLSAVSDKYNSRPEVWDIKWSSSDASSLAVVEKNRLVVFYDGKEDSSHISSGCVVKYDGMKLRLVAIDSLVGQASCLSEDFCLDIEVNTLKTCREMLTKVSTCRESEAYRGLQNCRRTA